MIKIKHRRPWHWNRRVRGGGEVLGGKIIAVFA